MLYMLYNIICVNYLLIKVVLGKLLNLSQLQNPICHVGIYIYFSMF